MYSPEIVERRLFRLRKQGLAISRLSRDDSKSISADLELLTRDGSGKRIENGGTRRAFTDKEQAFIQSETALCKIDFKYFFERYYNLEIDAGVLTGEAALNTEKVDSPLMLPSQHRYVELIGRREEDCHEEVAQHGFTSGIQAVFHKVRQVAATATARGITLHRMLFWPNTRCLAGSVDDMRVNELYRRDKIACNNLPFWLKPAKFYPDKAGKELGFVNPIDSVVSYQTDSQEEGGLGVGTQQDVVHLTEVALWVRPNRIRFSLLPALPKSVTTLLILESTSNGKGNYWHELSEAIRTGEEGYETWVYAFIPWWMNATKYRAIPTADWQPNRHTLAHYELVERTSPEYNDGMTVRLNKSQMYWWEKERAASVQDGLLAEFLTNFPATPEQSFQSQVQGALPADIIEWMEATSMEAGAMYEHYLTS